jgi:ring-1,2-phenylacetyl-CoA epoxidase subunit PaaA
MNKSRLDARRDAWNNGAWVRDAAKAYAVKQKDIKERAAV